MKNISRKIIALLFCLILATVQVAALADDSHAFYATFSITLRSNWVLSQYGVTVYLDGNEVGHLGQGDAMTFGAYMSDGCAHELRIVADKAGVPDRIWTISNLQHGSVLTVELQAKSSQVKIRSYELSVNGESLCSVSPDMEAKVRLIGTIILTGAKTCNAAK